MIALLYQVLNYLAKPGILGRRLGGLFMPDDAVSPGRIGDRSPAIDGGDRECQLQGTAALAPCCTRLSLV
jgi:hypothetical protein